MKTPLMIIIISLTLTGCSSISNMDKKAIVTATKAEMIPVPNPIAVQTIEIYDKNQNKRIEADVLSLESSVIRKRLTSTRTFISVEKRDSNGSFSYIGAGGKA